MPPVVATGIGLAVPELVGVTVGGAQLTSILGSVGFFGGLFGANKLLSKTKDQPEKKKWQLAPAPISFEPEIVNISTRFYSYGRNRLGGVPIFREADGVTLCYGLVLNCWPIDDIEGYFVDDELLNLGSGASTHPVIGPGGIYGISVFDEGPGVQWPKSGLKWTAFIGYIWTSSGPQPIVIGYGPCGYIEFRNATDEGFASTLLKRYFGDGSIVAQSGLPYWTDQHLCRGLAMLYSMWEAFAEDSRAAHYPRNGLPVHSTVFRGARVYDPRDPSQVFFLRQGGYGVHNPSWKYSANPALILAHYLTFPEGGGYSFGDINWEAFAAAADDCDRPVPAFGDKTEPFAEAHLTWSADQERRDVITQLEGSCDGHLYEDQNGKICLWIAKPIVPTLTLTTADIGSWQSEDHAGVYDDVNRIQGTYVEPRLNFAKSSVPDVTDDASIALVGDRASAMDMPAVQSFSQGYRLEHRALRRRNPVHRLTTTSGVRAILVDGGHHAVTVDMPEYGISGTYYVAGMPAESLARIGLTLERYADDAFDDVVPPYDPVNRSLPGVPSSLYTPAQAVLATIDTNISGATATITASVAQPVNDPNSIANFQMRPVDPTTHAPLGSGDWTLFPDAIGQYAAISPVIAGSSGVTQVFELQAWLVSPIGTPGAVSTSSFVTLAF